MGFCPTYVASSINETLAYPHYSDERWERPQLIYGRECKTAECNYSDRLFQWDHTAAERASEACKKAKLNQRTAKQVETWLSAYHDRPVKLRYILGGCNLSSGYPYYVYGYDYVTEAAP
jgi:hypothetical protein